LIKLFSIDRVINHFVLFKLTLYAFFTRQKAMTYT
jgi:hypothetical protein